MAGHLGKLVSIGALLSATHSTGLTTNETHTQTNTCSFIHYHDIEKIVNSKG